MLSLRTLVLCGATVLVACSDAEPEPLSPVESEWPSVELLTVKTAACTNVNDPMESVGATLRLLASPTAGAYRARFETTMACVEAAQTCDAVRDCISAELVTDCVPGCEGSVAVSCRFSTLAYREDCALSPAGATECRDGRCIAPDCDAESPPTCDGNILRSCVDQRSQAVDCAQFGGTCGATSAGEATCVFDGVACEPAAPSQCSGDGLITCEMKKGHGVLDCAELLFPSTCVPGSNVVCGSAEPRGPVACVPSCDGAVLNGCAGNIGYTLDCALMPGATCGDGTNGDPTCVMP